MVNNDRLVLREMTESTASENLQRPQSHIIRISGKTQQLQLLLALLRKLFRFF